MPTASGATALLAQLAMFRGVPRQRVADLARQALVRQFRAGGVIARRGECLPGLMTVRYGLAKLSFHSGPERVLRLVGPGETFGEAALFLGQPLPVDVVALADTGLLVVPAAPLLSLFDGDPRFARELLASVCRRLRSVVADFESASAYDARARLAAYLASLGEGGASLPAPKQVIAARLGMSKETLSRLLRDFIDEGLIAVVKREIRLLDRPRLSAVGQASASSEG